MKRAVGIIRRVVALLLAAALLASSAPLRGAAAAEARQPVSAPERSAQPAVLQTAEGELPVEEDWNEAYPYGTFAFGSYQADVGEAGAADADGRAIPQSVLIPVYRLGGTHGRVTAWITYAPALTTDADGAETVCDYAASALDDLLVEYEDPNPVAAYQPLGIPQQLRAMQPGAAAVILADESAPSEDGGLTLALSNAPQAESYRWQASQNGVWKDIPDAGDAQSDSVDVERSLLWDFETNAWSGTDLRCIYVVDGRAYCAESLLGEVYEPLADPEPMPEDLEPDSEPGYSRLEADERYGLYEFPLTFADGETVKYVRVTALDDETAELPELGLFTITGCEGGELSAACNTLTLMVSDNDRHGPSTLGFAEERVCVSRGSASVRVPIRREGDKSYNVTVRYATKDGTAKAGVDYAAVSGELSFAGSIDDIEIPIELIDNGAQDERSFTVELTELQGDGPDRLCTLQTRELTVTVTGGEPENAAGAGINEAEASGDASLRARNAAGRNLATVLADKDGVEVAASVSVADSPLLADNSEPMQGHAEMTAPEPLGAELAFSTPTRSHRVEGCYKFRRGDSYSSTLWRDWEILLGEAGDEDAANTAQHFYESDRDYGAILDEIWTDEDYIEEHRYFDAWEDYRGDNDDYYAMKTSANWSGTMTFSENDSFDAPFGDYFWQFLIDVEWHRIGVQDTSTSWSANRYLLPTFSYYIGGSRTKYEFYVTGDEASLKPNRQTVRCFTDGESLDDKRGSSWSKGEPDYSANNIGFGKHMELEVDLTHCYTWTDEYTKTNKDLMDYDNSHVDIRRFLGRRRTFNQTHQGIDLVIYTPNDSDELPVDGSGELCAYSALSADNGLYKNLSPTVSVVDGEGGVDSEGNLYLGSKLCVTVPTYLRYFVQSGGVFMTNSKGQKVGTVTDSGSGVFYITLMWDGIGGTDEGETYTLHVIYNRENNIRIDIGPSVPRKAGSETYEDADIAKAWSAFIAGGMECRYTRLTNDVQFTTENGAQTDHGVVFSGTTVGSVTKTSSDFGSSKELFTLNSAIRNVQEVCFHKDPKDLILFNGVAYPGDAWIKITERDLGRETLDFTYYDKEYLDAVSPMLVKLDHAEVYYDRGGETLGFIEGEMGDTVFEPAGDDYIGYFKGDYTDASFKPVVDTDGGVHQYFLKVFYSIRPRAIVLPKGASMDDRAQMLPAFVSAITGDGAGELTREQKSYRWIAGNEVDNKLMYGEAAGLLQYVDIPLGGDASDVEMEYVQKLIYAEPEEGSEPRVVDSYDKITYTWEPQYVGKILVPFDNPEPVVSTNNITGSPVPMAGEDAAMNSDGSFSYSAEGLDNLNAFLASFVGRTTFALGVQEQAKPSGELTGLKEIKPESVAVGEVSTTPSPDELTNLQGDGNVGTAQGQGPGGSIGREEFQPDLGVELPNLEFELGDYATIVMDGYNVGFTVGFPVFKTEQTEYSGSRRETASTSAGKTYTYIDNDGNHCTEFNSADGKTKTTTTVAETEQTLVTTTVTQTTDDQGRTTNQKKVTREKKVNGRWEPDTSQTNTNAPQTPTNSQSPTRAEKARENFKKSNEAMGTLLEFCDKVRSRDKVALKNFMKGSILDDDTFAQAKKGNTTCRKVEATFSVQIAIMFEYNPVDNCHYFKTAGISATVGVEFTAQARLACFPAAYVYLKLGVEVEAAISLSCYRQAVEGKLITGFVTGSPKDMKEGKAKRLVFKLDMREDEEACRGFHMDLTGTVYMTVYEKSDLSGEMLTSGYLIGDGGQKEILFEEYDKIVYVCLEARGSEWPIITNLKPVVAAESKVVFDGLNITPSLSLEVGAGVGVELLKVEVYLKTSVAITLTMGGYLPDTDRYEGFYVSSFEWNIALGVHITALFFNFDMDFISFAVEGAQKGTGGYFTWDLTASSFNGAVELWSDTVYTTAGGRTLDGEPEEPYGVNLFKDMNGITFYNPNGNKTDTSSDAPKSEGWEFDESVSAARWGGGAFNGEIPLNADLAYARKKDAYVEFTTGNSEINLYFDGRIDVWDSHSRKTSSFVKSPAKLTFGDSTSTTVRVTATEKGTKLDRYCTPQKKTAVANRYIQPTAGGGESLVRVSEPANVTASQRVRSAFDGESTRAVTPSATSDFQLSGCNTSGDAKTLVEGLTTGYSYKLAQAGQNSYLVYPLMLGGVPQLVLSRLVMQGDLNGAGTGLVHPLEPTNTTPYLVLDDDGFTDLDYAVQGSADGLTVRWVSCGDKEGGSYLVKSRSVDLAANRAGTVTTLDSAESYLFLPASEGETALWAEAFGSGAEANELLKAWLIAKNEGLSAQMLEDVSVSDPRLANPVFLWATQSKLNELYGAGTLLVSSAGDEAELTGQLQNMETVRLGSKTYILYTTAEAAYFDASAETPVTVTLDGIDAQTERGVIYRLYLRTLDQTGFGTAKLLQTVIDFDGCTDDNLAEAALKDGIYVQSARVKAQADPYFANLRFVSADIDGTGVQTLGLFEMGGNSYLISEADLKAVTNGSGGAVLTPIFSAAVGTEVNIGSDGTNLAAVYTAPVANSLSNAIYAAWWDRNLNAWGAPTILAMRNLQIYEDSIAYDMDPADVEKAYLGELTTEGGHTGSMDKLTFSDLQMATRSVQKSDGTEGRQLLVLTEGSFVRLKEHSFNMGDGRAPYDTVVPEGDPQVRFYAIAFGEGEQALGEASLAFANYDFSIGSRLAGELSFTNTGTAAIRASDANPAAIQLKAGDQVIAEWALIQSIPSGASIRLTFNALPLTDNLAAGTKFSLQVTEDTYFSSRFFAELPELFTVEQKPELSFGVFNVTFDSVEKAQGAGAEDAAKLSFNATVLNNGSDDADKVFVQFSYGTGEIGADGCEIYKPIDLRGSEFSTSEQHEIPKRGAVAEDLSQGVYQLRDDSGGTGLQKNHYRSVAGTLRVPIHCFADQENYSGLHLRAEIFSDADTPDLHYGVYTSDHNEYNETNNRFETTLKHRTEFSVPANISTALGTTLTIPVSFTSTSSRPDIVVTEISDGSEDWSPRMGVCYYDAARGVIVAAPNATAQALLQKGEKPTGILQIKDCATNSLAAIAYKVGSMADGVNIYRDDASFSFFDPDGRPTNLSAQLSENPGWRFVDENAELGWICGERGELPMNNDLCLAHRDGAYLRFETVADSLTFYYVGEIAVRLEPSGVEQSFVSEISYADPEHPVSRPATVRLNNSTGQRFTVTVTAKKGTRLDRYVASYLVNTVPSGEAGAPQLLWSRSFPDTASCKPGQSVPMRCYILDSAGLGSVTFDGVALSESGTPALVRVDEGLWYFDCAFTDNGVYTVRAVDLTGNSSASRVNVDWFNTVVNAGASAAAPGLSPADLSIVKQDGSLLGAEQTETPPYLRSAYTLKSGERIDAYLFADGSFSDVALPREADGRWQLLSNGYYLVRVSAQNGAFTQAVVRLTGLTAHRPQLSAALGERCIDIIAADNQGIASLTVNGYLIASETQSYAGKFPITASGEYRVELRDAEGNRVNQTVTAELPLALREDCVLTHVDCGGESILGSITVNAEGLSGGDYLPGESDPAQNRYVNRYFAALAPSGTDAGQLAESDWVRMQSGSHTFTGLAEGSYDLFVRDASGHTAVCATLLLYHPDGLWSEPEYLWSEDLETVTATRVCGLDAAHRQTETVKTNFILVAPSTFKQDGVGVYTAEFNDPAFHTQQRQIAIPAINCTGGDSCPGKNFTDIPPLGSFSHIPIDWAVVNKVTNGVTPTTFAPKDVCTRAQFVTFLWRTTGQPEPATESNPFTDVKTRSFYYKAVLWAVENGITTGTSETTFSPSEECSRAQVVTFLWRMEGSEEPQTSDNPFTDVKTSAYYFKAVLWAVEKNITKGTTATSFDPKGFCTREQCVTFLYREFAG